MDLTHVTWTQRTVLAIGSWSVIYLVAPDVVAKVGQIDLEEAEIQRAVAAHGLALPVLGFWPAASLPLDVRHEVEHRLIESGAHEPTGPIAVLLMPRAEILYNEGDFLQWSQANPHTCQKMKNVMERVSRICSEELAHTWDNAYRNVARYQDRLVALDFGGRLGPRNPERDKMERNLNAALTVVQGRARPIEAENTGQQTEAGPAGSDSTQGNDSALTEPST